MMAEPERLAQVGRKELMAQAKRGDVVVLDVRPPEEFDTAHLPYARSMPLAELAQRLAELPRDVEIVAYCRGPFCLMSDEAVALLRKRGFRARKTFDGVSEWQAAGLPVTAADPADEGSPWRIAMTFTLFIVNDAPYGNERAYNALRLAGALASREDQPVRLFLMADAVGCAKSGQKVPEGYYNVQIMLGKVARKGEVGLCGTCMDARGLRDDELIDGAKRGTLVQLADWTAEADKVLVF
jgi:uncharacterized protein involved in oxidation of intracellular sulfur